MMGYTIGWIGVAFGFMVAPPQLYKIVKSRNTDGISLWTYIFLCCALVCYLIHAISISAPVFIVAQSVNLVTNIVILGFLIKRRESV